MPFALVALAAVPAIAGSLRLLELAGGPQAIPADTRFTTSPVAVVVHIVSAVTYAVLGAFQFSATLRRRRPRWHRRAGRVLVALGLAVALSALWLTLFYPSHPGNGELAYVFRLAFGSGMAASIVLGFAEIRSRRRSPAPGLDDPRLRIRPRRGNPGVHPGHRRCCLRVQRARP